MASRVVLHRGKVVAYLPSLQGAVRHFRSLSSYNGPRQEVELLSAVVDPQTDKPLSQLGPFNPLERMFPLPGRVAPLSTLDTSTATNQPLVVNHRDAVHLLPASPQLHHEQVIRDMQGQEMGAANETEAESQSVARLEVQALQCTDRMKKEFSGLFPKGTLENRDITVITVSQKTENDMSMWSADVEDEREDLLQHFIYGAEDICHTLQEAGYWADFIDPSSGQPYLGAHTNTALFETDDRYRLLGFQVDDLGCCKVMSHPLWGSYSYVGCIFTDAPYNHPLLQSMLTM